MPRAPGISACIVAANEEDRIGACLASLSWCDEILVIDSHSHDRTRDVARAYGARVVERDWPGYRAQKEYAIRRARYDWVMCVDADERVSPGLAKEIVELRAAGFPGADGWCMPRLSSYLGRTIRAGTWYPDLQLRLFDRRRGHWGGRDLHERVDLDGACGRLGGELLHHPYRDFDEHLTVIRRYAAMAAASLRAEGRRASGIDLLLRPGWRFLRFYVLTGGWRAGWRGLLLASLSAHYVRLKYAGLWSLSRPWPR